ncbi:MAG: hypothetical protein HKP27_12535, partial [Myxococcales bacterium]|nr:hypothetical protein [Myxococcales bacterium]
MSLSDRYEQDLSAYLDGELDAAAAAELERRLEESPQLRERLAQLRAADAALAGAPASEPSAELFSQIRARIAAEQSPRRRRSAAKPNRIRRPFFGAAAAVAAAAVAALLLWPNPPGESPREIARVEPGTAARPRIEPR